MSRTRLLTPKEVDRLIPQIELLLNHVDTLRQRIRALQSVPELSPSSGVAESVAQNQLRKSQVDFLLRAIQDDVQEIQTLGGVIKDLDAGLVDFPGWIRGEEVWLCWKRGETHIRYWHALHEGYTQRQALDRSSGTTLH